MNNQRLTLNKARTLVKRELGINAMALEKTPGMNDNPKYPWYSLTSGNLSVAVYTTERLECKIIVLHISFNDGLGSITRYFYCDDLTEATEYMEFHYWQDRFEAIEGKQQDTMLSRLSTQATKACQHHLYD